MHTPEWCYAVFCLNPPPHHVTAIIVFGIHATSFSLKRNNTVPKCKLFAATCDNIILFFFEYSSRSAFLYFMPLGLYSVALPNIVVTLIRLLPLNVSMVYLSPLTWCLSAVYEVTSEQNIHDKISYTPTLLYRELWDVN